jgi:hypothetical protein
MKIYGIAKRKTNSPGLVLSEVTFHGSAEEIRAVARFLAEKADKMEHPTFGHAHLQDHCATWQAGDPDVIVVSDLTYPIKK